METIDGFVVFFFFKIFFLRQNLGKMTSYPKLQTFEIEVGSVQRGFGSGFVASITASHRSRNSLRVPFAGMGFVGRLQWQCGKVGASRSCWLRY